jgi:carboxylesterase type B
MSPLPFTLFAWLVISNLPCTLSAPHVITERAPAPSGPEITSNGATFVGTTDDNYGVSIWSGIRYAKPPIGSLRLQPPQKVDNDGTILTQSFGAQCFQMDPPAGANISEDCLYLNIYKPSQAALDAAGMGNHDHVFDCSDCLPVMFWIHGGGFNDGSGQIYDSRSLVNTSVALKTPTIIVTINYRLSFFGFSGIFAAPEGHV